MSGKQNITVELTQEQLDYLDKMIDKYGLPDRGKALRCLVNFPRDTPSEEDRVFGEVRCLDC
ncbi:MAG: hypothetical protein P8M22_11875 [Phycisphaerales bacterium]|nr:hypothetical protein [Phycisphaerales bacterium]